jgi:hypothetical protein
MRFVSLVFLFVSIAQGYTQCELKSFGSQTCVAYFNDASQTGSCSGSDGILHTISRTKSPMVNYIDVRKTSGAETYQYSLMLNNVHPIAPYYNSIAHLKTMHLHQWEGTYHLNVSDYYIALTTNLGSCNIDYNYTAQAGEGTGSCNITSGDQTWIATITKPGDARCGYGNWQLDWVLDNEAYQQNQEWQTRFSTCLLVTSLPYNNRVYEQSLKWKLDNSNRTDYSTIGDHNTLVEASCKWTDILTCINTPSICPAGQTCYQKDTWYAQCMTTGSCVEGVHATDPPQYQTPWSCAVSQAQD